MSYKIDYDSRSEKFFLSHDGRYINSVPHDDLIRILGMTGVSGVEIGDMPPDKRQELTDFVNNFNKH